MRSILLLPLVARCLETIDVCIWRMFVFMSVVAQPTRVQDLSAVNVTSQSQADRVNRNAYRYNVVTLVLFICK